MQINQFTFDGRRSYDDMSLIITQSPDFVSAERDVEAVSIPGRSGDLLIDKGRYKNASVEYSVSLLAAPTEFAKKLDAIAAWLNSSADYRVLTDTYDPDYFRYARFAGILGVSAVLRQIGRAKVTFDCKPYKYSFAGQSAVAIGTSGTVRNPETQASEPHIKITGSGDITLTVNKHVFELYGVDGEIEIDSELCAAYKGKALQNDKIGFSRFPELLPGDNGIAAVGDVTEISITPRWRKI